MPPEVGDIEASWQRIEAFLEAEHPEAFAGLRPGASEDAIRAAEAELGVSLPGPFRRSVLRHDGQDIYGPWLVDGGLLCRLEDLLEEWRWWMEEQDSGELDELIVDIRADSGVRDDRWWRRGWLPFVAHDGDHLVLDLEPAPEGDVGQVFAFSKGTGPGRLAAPDFASWLQVWAEELEAGIIRPLEGPYVKGEDGEDDDFYDEHEDEGGGEAEDEDVDEDEDLPRVTSRTWPS